MDELKTLADDRAEPEYLIEYGVYVNCHISHVEERTIAAASYDEAKTLANGIADAMEEELKNEQG